MSVSVKYKGTEIASMAETGTKTLLTSGKYCDADIVVENTKDSSSFNAQIIATTKPKATVRATKNELTVSGTADAEGICTLTVPEAGTWSIVAELSGILSDAQTVIVDDSYGVSLSIPVVTILVSTDVGASVSLKKDGIVLETKESDGSVIFTITETGTYTVDATKGGVTNSGTVQVVAGTLDYWLNLSSVSTTLNDNDWSLIKSVSDKGQGENFWSIGDRKEITLSGTVGELTLSSFTTYAFIIGFNHNAALEGDNRIHFQLAKTALSGGTDVCLCDSSYGSSGNSAAFRMNKSNTNSGGWESSFMRTGICGTDLASYDGTIIAVIPSALRAVLKSVTKYTNNTGSSSSESAVTATTDYFFLLSEYEVFGTRTYANQNEAGKQAQYAYYSAGNSKVKYKHDATTTAVYWWLRSPLSSYSSYFVSVHTDGTVNYSIAYYSRGFAPGFCV